MTLLGTFGSGSCGSIHVKVNVALFCLCLIVLVQPRNTGIRHETHDMTEKLLTGTLSFKTNKIVHIYFFRLNTRRPRSLKVKASSGAGTAYVNRDIKRQ